MTDISSKEILAIETVISLASKQLLELTQENLKLKQENLWLKGIISTNPFLAMSVLFLRKT